MTTCNNNVLAAILVLVMLAFIGVVLPTTVMLWREVRRDWIRNRNR